MTRWACFIAALLSLLTPVLQAPAAAQAPTIGSLSPLAVRPGASVDLKVRGANLGGAQIGWTSFPAEAALAPDIPNNGMSAEEIIFRVTAPAEAPVGVHGMRVVTPQGTSPLRLIVVDDLPSVAQQPENTSREAAQEIVLPVAVDGAVENLKLNYYRFKAEAGQRVAMEVLARRIGSPLDPMIRVFNPAGRELAWSDDAAGLSSDPQLAFTAPESGEYVVEVRDIRYQGSGNHIYRLRIGDFPLVNTPHPMAAQRGTTVSLGFAGSDVADVAPVSFAVPADVPAPFVTVGAKRASGQSSGMAVLSVTEGPQFLESEPNDAAEQANRIELGMGINGRFEAPGDVDRYVFGAKKDQKFAFTSVTRSQGSPSDLLLRLYNAAGEKVAEAEDSGMLDGSLTYQFPADGDYTLVVTDLLRRGGSPYAYRIETHASGPSFSLAATADHVNVPAGGTAAIQVNATRQDYGGPIELTAVGLPPGLTSVPTVIGPGLNSAVLTVSAAPDAPAQTVTTVRLAGSAMVGEAEIAAVAETSSVLKSANAAMPWPPRGLEESVGLAVAPATGLKIRTESPEVVLGTNLSATIKLIAERGPEFDEAINLDPGPEALKGLLPEGMAVAFAPIDKGANEAAITISANDKVPLGEYTLVLTGKHIKGDVTRQVVLPGIRVKVEPHFQLTLDLAGGKVVKGGELKVKVTAERNPSFSKPITVTLQNLPAGLTAEPATIAEGQNEAELIVKAQADATAVSVDNITAKGDAKAGEADVSATSPAVSLTVE